MEFEKRWTRWHSDGWTGVVMKNHSGEWFYDMWQGDPKNAWKRASGLADAQHRAEEIVRASGHRCVARCSFWVPDVPDDL